MIYYETASFIAQSAIYAHPCSQGIFGTVRVEDGHSGPTSSKLGAPPEFHQ